MNFAVTYGPKALSDFHHYDQKLAAMSYVGGNNTRPLLLYGPAGTGKTAFARALAENLCADVSQHDIMFINGSMENSIDTVREKIATFASVTKFNERGLSIIIIDEADGFSGSAQNALKAEIDRVMPYTLFILTTNHLEKLAAPIRDRCKVAHCPWPMPGELLPLAQKIVLSEGETISDEKLFQVLGADYAYIRGLSYRQMFQRLEDLVGLRRLRGMGNPTAAEAKLS